MNVGRYLRGEDSHVGTSRITKPKELKMNKRIKKLAEQAELWDILDQYSWEFGNCDAEKDCGDQLEKFVQLMLEECVSSIKHESLKQLDPEFGIIYAKAMLARFGATLNQPFLRVEVKD
jgi:hypothetical protein